VRHQNADAEIKSVVRILRGGGGGRRQWRQQNDQEEHTCKQNTCGEYVHDLSEALHNVRKQFQNGMNFCSGAADSPGRRAPPKAAPAKEPKATDSCYHGLSINMVCFVFFLRRS
jgi:hypothetical protein